MFGASSFQSGSSQPLSAARQNHCWPLMILMRGSPDVITAASISHSVRHGERQTAESAEESHTHLRADVQVRVAVRWEMGVWLASQVRVAARREMCGDDLVKLAARYDAQADGTEQLARVVLASRLQRGGTEVAKALMEVRARTRCNWCR